MGITRRMREMDPNVRVVAVEPFAGHKIQGLKNMQESYPPGIFERDELDRVIRVEDEEAFEACRRLAAEEGIFAGMSSGAAMAGALKLAAELEGTDATLVVIFPDGGERYLSTPLFAPKAGQGVKIVDAAARGEKFLAPADEELKLYTPGPGADAVGDAEFWRRMVFLDVLARFLSTRGVKVRVAAGLADLDDRAVAAAREAGEPRSEYAADSKARTAAVASLLGVREDTDFVLASEYLDAAVEACEKLMNKGLAYEKLRSVYFDSRRDKNYGEVAGQDADKLESRRGAEAATYSKDHPRDFTLLKRALLLDIKDGEFRQTRWGNVRPSWFLQMAAAGTGALGKVDVVAAAEGQRFPHLDNLRAVWANGAGFSPQAWMVVGEAAVQEPAPEDAADASPGSRPSIEPLLGPGAAPGAVRMWLLSASYHKPLVFSGPTLSMWAKNRNRVQNLASRLAAATPGGEVGEDAKQALALLRKDFREAVENDLSLYKFWPSLFEFCRDTGARLDKGLLSGAGAAACLKELRRLDEVLRILDTSALPVPAESLPEEVANMVAEREKARASKDFAAADALRDALEERGWRVKDSSKGALVFKIG
jgi:cysteinyl-tRNA synthetase